MDNLYANSISISDRAKLGVFGQTLGEPRIIRGVEGTNGEGRAAATTTTGRSKNMYILIM